ncbi:uncharacterized protein BDV14DRAFT_33244 [Aspergillus stella-maris]|uniref:uncharacterized protein n=1 Tax=Aspergillus stella-maris TaxID=1810926 RepID=UPI003CCDD012
MAPDNKSSGTTQKHDSQDLSPVAPISKELDEQVQYTLSSKDEHILPEELRYRPTRQNLLDCYHYPGQLNDEVVNAYLNLITVHVNQKGFRTHVLNSFFFTKLKTEGHKAVQSWVSGLAGAKLLQFDTILMPVHVNSHWMLIVVHPHTGIIQGYDSLSSSQIQGEMNRVKEWLVSEFKDRNHADYWITECPDSPKQDNGSDCGVFVLASARFAAIKQPPTYSQEDIPEMRKRVVTEIICNTCLDHNSVNGPAILKASKAVEPEFHIYQDGTEFEYDLTVKQVSPILAN